PRGPRPARARRGTRAKRCKRWWASFALSSLGLPRALPLLQVGYPLRHGARLARRQLLVALIVLHGLLGVLQVEIVEDARVEMRESIIRLEGERLLVVAACVVELALAPRYHAELVVVGGAIRVEADRFPERIERLRRPAGAPVEDAEVRLRSGEPRLASRHGEQQALGLGIAAGLERSERLLVLRARLRAHRRFRLDQRPRRRLGLDGFRRRGLGLLRGACDRLAGRERDAGDRDGQASGAHRSHPRPSRSWRNGPAAACRARRSFSSPSRRTRPRARAAP